MAANATTSARTAPPNGRTPTATLVRPRRSPTLVVTGGLLVVVMALAFMWIELRTDRSVDVLAVARPVAAGQMVTAADLRVASVVPDASVRLVPATQLETVVGRAAAVPLVAGALLAASQLGPAAWPAAGEAVVALPLKVGRLPAGVTAGARVRVLVVRTSDESDKAAPAPTGPTATVVDLGEADASGTVVVSLLLQVADAGIAASGDEATLVLLGPVG